VSIADGLMIPNQCFWCEAVLAAGEGTRDHLISRPLAGYLYQSWGGAEACHRNRNRHAIVTACRACNGTRAKISTAFYILRKIKNTMKAKRDPNYIRSFHKQRKKILDILIDMEKLLLLRLEGEILDLCLIEVKALLQPIEVGEVAGSPTQTTWLDTLFARQ
jgi:hypothetical protein